MIFYFVSQYACLLYYLGCSDQLPAYWGVQQGAPSGQQTRLCLLPPAHTCPWYCICNRASLSLSSRPERRRFPHPRCRQWRQAPRVAAKFRWITTRNWTWGWVSWCRGRWRTWRGRRCRWCGSVDFEGFRPCFLTCGLLLLSLVWVSWIFFVSWDSIHSQTYYLDPNRNFLLIKYFTLPIPYTILVWKAFLLKINLKRIWLRLTLSWIFMILLTISAVKGLFVTLEVLFYHNWLIAKIFWEKLQFVPESGWSDQKLPFPGLSGVRGTLTKQSLNDNECLKMFV